MKKILFAILAVSATFLFSACGSFWDDPIGRSTGSATSIVNGVLMEYESSIVMIDKEATPKYAVGLASVMTIGEMLDIDDENDIIYPVFCYRFTGENIKSGATLTANNVLTEEDLVDFDYTSIINGKFSDNQSVGFAESDTKFYIMSTGTITLDKVKKSKVKGSYSGRAYVIDRNADPMLSEEQVDFSGTFVSRVTPMMPWVSRIQEGR